MKFPVVLFLLLVAASIAKSNEFQTQNCTCGLNFDELVPLPEQEICAVSYSSAMRWAQSSWAVLLTALGDRVELVEFDGTLLQHRNHASLRRTVRSLHLLEGTEVSGIRAGDMTLVGVNDTDNTINFNVKLRPLKIRGALRTSDHTHLLRCFLVDMTLRFKTDMANNHTVYGLARAGHVTHVQVANGDRTETAFGQDLEALLAGAAVTTVFHEVERAASIHLTWKREPRRALHWNPHQVPDSWEGRHPGGALP